MLKAGNYYMVKFKKTAKKNIKKCRKMKNVKTHQKWIKANATPKIKNAVNVDARVAPWV